MGAFELLPSGGAVQPLSSFGETLFEDFDSLGSVGTVLPTGWTSTTGAVFSTAITESFPTTVIASGTYNAGSGGDRTLATGNFDRSATNSLQLSAQLTGPNDVRAVVLEARIEAWFGDAVIADNPGEAAVVATLEFDPEQDGTYQMAETFNGGAPITTGLVLAPGEQQYTRLRRMKESKLQSEVDTFLTTGEHDLGYRNWPGRNFMERAEYATECFCEPSTSTSWRSRTDGLAYG